MSKAKRAEFKVVDLFSSLSGELKETGRCGLQNHTLAQAKKFARAESRYWPDRIVTLTTIDGHALYSFKKGRETALTAVPAF